MKGLPPWILVALLFIISNCDSKRVFEGKKDFSDRFWSINNPAEFNFEIDDTDKSYNLLVNIRNTASFKYQNIYLQYYLEDSTGRVLSKELKNIQLFNAKTGIPHGKGIGGFYDIERTFLEEYNFEHKGLYKLRIDQFMRQDSLAEILSVGLRVEFNQ
jgi:gliding motility-associated lipoprotein GldH